MNSTGKDPALGPLVEAARAGSLVACGALVEATQRMAYAVAWHVLRDEAEARDAVQDAYLSAFRRLSELNRPETFAGWLRRIVVTHALNRRRRVRRSWLLGEQVPGPPVLDDDERRWTDEQQRLLSRAVLTLSDDERRVCERYYHGGWSAERLAEEAGIASVAMRKRLQRIRDKLRKEIEMDESRTLQAHPLPAGLPESILELLARPRLCDLPDNPVGATVAALQAAFAEFSTIEVPEQIDLGAAQEQLGGDAVYIQPASLQRISGERVLRYDLTLPLLLELRTAAGPQRRCAAGKVYRREHETATHLQAFHQFELFVLDRRGAVDPWWLAGRILQAIDTVLPRREVRMCPTEYPMCARAFSLDVQHEGQWVEIMAWGEYADWVMRALSADPACYVALGAGFGLERIGALRYGIDDIRKMASARIVS